MFLDKRNSAKKWCGQVQNGRIFLRFGRVWWTPRDFGNQKMRSGEKKLMDGFGPLYTGHFNPPLVHHPCIAEEQPAIQVASAILLPLKYCATKINKVAISPGVAPIIVGVHVNSVVFENPPVNWKNHYLKNIIYRIYCIDDYGLWAAENNCF